MIKMAKFRWKNLLFWVAITEAVGLFSGLITRDGVKLFQQTVAQPPLSPPGWIFLVVWSILYALMGVSASLVNQSMDAPMCRRGLNRMIAQLILNFFWSPIFFNLQAYGLSLLWLIALWVVVFIMIRKFLQCVPLAGKLQIPYLLWLSFAVYLNAGVLLLN